jgi:hypothetical protein
MNTWIMPVNFTKVLLLWIPMPFLGIINGAFRQAVILKYVDDLRAHQISTFTLIVLLAIYVHLIFKKLYVTDYTGAWITGVTWLLLTLIFEFSLGYFVSHLSLIEMLADYNIFQGRLWPLVPLSVLLLPVIYTTALRKL